MINLLATPVTTIAIILVVVVVLVLAMILLLVVCRYKKCPSDKIMVIYGKISSNKDGTYRSAKCIHGGAAFIWPFIQSYTFLDLTPLSISVDLKSALSKQNIRIDVPSIFTVGISTDPAVMQNAAERLLGLQLKQISELAKDIIFGQLRLVIATMDIEEINTDRDKFLEAISRNVEGELKKLGLRLINVNVTDISDESGYIVALGKEAAAKAINDAKISVAEENRKGAIGEANAQMQQRINVADAESKAIEGENKAKAEIAQSKALLRQKEAEAMKVAVAAENVQAAKAKEESYAAEQVAETARAAREKATREADIIVASEIEKRKIEIEADAQAENIRRKAKGEADAIYAKMEAEARGLYETLSKQAEGMDKLVKAAGTADEAVRLMIADKLEELVATQVEAVKNLKIDKVTVWENGQNTDGKTSTANFVSGMMKSLPPLDDLYSMVGLKMPKLIAPEKVDSADKTEKTKQQDKKPSDKKE
ncbi:MAG: flotillin family protein [Clostridia bacterium]|nr:flotillin family protein [Clostridia bacterium]